MNKDRSRREHSSWVARDPRRRALFGVAAGLALLVVVNAVVREPSMRAVGGHFVGPPALPVVQMTKPGAWHCPGPLPVGAGKEWSRISIVNGGVSAVNLLVVVSRTGLPKSGVSSGASISRTRLAVAGESQTVVPLSARGPAGFAAVSVVADGGGIGVGESIVGGSTAGGPVVVSSPCSLVAAPQGFVPTGSTYGGSDVRLSLFDSDATPAVVNVVVSTGTGPISPPAFQGVVVPATGLVVLDLHRWVFEQSSLAVTVTAVSGKVVVGALELTSETVDMASKTTTGHRIAHVRVTGSSLLVGPDSGCRRWSFAAMQSRRGVASTFSVFNPTTRPVPVTVAPPGPLGKGAALSEEVRAGGVVEFAMPVTGKSGLGTGSVVISADNGAPIVVARVTTRYRTRYLEDIDVTPGTAGPSDEWLVPGGSLAPGLDDVVTLDDPGTTAASVTLLELTHEATGPSRLEVVSLGAGSEIELNVGSVLKYAPSFALLVSAGTPILVEQQLRFHDGLTTASGAIPVRR